METKVASSTKVHFLEGLVKVKVIYFTELENKPFSDAVTSQKQSSSN
jgi:hypothetical protein